MKKKKAKSEPRIVLYVPLEPTETMLDIGVDTENSSLPEVFRSRGNIRAAVRQIYINMLEVWENGDTAEGLFE